MGRYPRRKPVPHLTYHEPLYAVCYHGTQGEANLIGDAPYIRRVAQRCAKAFNSTRGEGQPRAILCPVSHMIIDTAPLDNVPCKVVLDPVSAAGKKHHLAGQVVHRGKASDCEAIADTFNERENETPKHRKLGLKAVVVPKGVEQRPKRRRARA
jgi:hypothetical protein